MDYTIIATTLDECDLANKVREYMSHGWKPQGGVCVTFLPPGGAGYVWVEDDSILLYMQAMVHEVLGAFQPGIDV